MHGFACRNFYSLSAGLSDWTNVSEKKMIGTVLVGVMTYASLLGNDPHLTPCMNKKIK